MHKEPKEEEEKARANKEEDAQRVDYGFLGRGFQCNEGEESDSSGEQVAELMSSTFIISISSAVAVSFVLEMSGAKKSYRKSRVLICELCISQVAIPDRFC